MHARSHPVFAISVAAELAGTTIANLRVYERQGLLAPERTEGGTRRYSQDNVDTIRHIRELLDAGLNLAGIERVIILEAEVAQLTALVSDARSSASSGSSEGGPAG